MRMRAPAFWWQSRGMLSALLSPVGAVVGKITAWRMRRPARHRARLPVVCIGNFVLGGAGKTPVALSFARLLAEHGAAPAFLTRGYGGELAGPVVVDAAIHTAAQVGDEPLLLARAAPTVVSADRAAGAAMAERGSASVLIMDDGFQSPTLAKTVSLVVVDGAVGVGNGGCVPAGPLRAPLADQLGFADAVVMLGDGLGGEAVALVAREAGKPVFRASLEPSAEAVRALSGKRVYAFAGIGRPEKFAATLTALGAEVVHLRPFADHQPFSGADADAIRREAERAGLVTVTTEKDFVRLAGSADASCRRLAQEVTVLPVTCRFADEAGLIAFLMERLAAADAHDVAS